MNLEVIRYSKSIFKKLSTKEDEIIPIYSNRNIKSQNRFNISLKFASIYRHHQPKLFILIIIVFSILFQSINSFDYCCCLFSKDPFRGYNIHESQIMSFDHSGMDKESIGYKMINQCYRTYNGFPTLENINMLKRDIYSIDKKQCDKDCNYFIREINEKYNIKQEENRENEAKRLKELRKKFMIILNKKINENTKSLYKGKPCKAEIKPNKKDVENEKKINNIKIFNSEISGSGNAFSGSYSSMPTLADLSIDSDNDQEPSYLQIENPKYNVEFRLDKEKKKNESIKREIMNNIKREDKNSTNKILISDNKNQNNGNPTTNNFQQELTEIELNSDLKLAELLKNNPNYLSLKTNFKQDKEITEEDITSEEELKKEIEKLEIQIIYLNKRNKKPIDFILDRFSIQDDVLVKIIKIFETSLDEVINNIRSYFEDTVYFQFKVADKYNANSKGTNKKK